MNGDMTKNDTITESVTIKELENKLDSLDAQIRRNALLELIDRTETGEIQLPAPGDDINMHIHTFYSFNAEGYSPTQVAWLAKKNGLALAGIVDFDVMDALEEFREAGRLLNLKAAVSFETRVYVPEFASRALNSPGEPGVSYHMGVGMPFETAPQEYASFQASLRETAQTRNRDLISRVNEFLQPVMLDLDKDVVPMTPKGNATERHICVAYTRQAAEQFPDAKALARYWQSKLAGPIDPAWLPDGKELLNLIRAKTMKRGGAGYMQPDSGTFPNIADVNAYVLAAGGIPTMTWLDGTSDGEQALEEWLDVAIAYGSAATNIIPDRNYTPGLGETDQKCQNLYDFVKAAEARDLPVIVGTEMNAPGQKFVDDFSSAELAPLKETFLKGALIAYAHMSLQRHAKCGYTSDWASAHFKTAAEKNVYFEKVGRLLQPNQGDQLNEISINRLPGEILEQLES
jgi:hypothetical protein